MKTYNKFEVAKILGVSPTRVRQLVSELGLVPERGRWGEYKFIQYHISAMRKRKTKAGPREKNGGKK